MRKEVALEIIKFIHTIIWVFYNIVIFYMLYAVIVDKLDIWLWIGYALVLLEALVLLYFKFVCPLSIIARKYSTSRQDNFDIYLPLWLARYNKQIYTTILAVIFCITIVRLVQ